MIISLKTDANKAQIQHIITFLKERDIESTDIEAADGKVIIALGNTSKLDYNEVKGLAGVNDIHELGKNYTLVSRDFSKETKVIDVDGVKIGGDNLVVMAGPCSIENKEQIERIAFEVKEAGADILRGGAYKPRTSAYSFQGLGLSGLEHLKEASVKTKLPIITESTGLHRHEVDGCEEEHDTLHNVIHYTDIIQIGTRNMKAYGFLEEIGRRTKGSDMPILLKRGESATIDEFLAAAEYLVKNGNPNVILCLRGIRTFEATRYQRYTSDIAAISVIKQLSNLPVVFDPSHATGDRALVKQLSMAAVAAGADGLIIEAHYDPDNAASDGAECVTADVLKNIITDCKKLKNML